MISRGIILGLIVEMAYMFMPVILGGWEVGDQLPLSHLVFSIFYGFSSTVAFLALAMRRELKAQRRQAEEDLL